MAETVEGVEVLERLADYLVDRHAIPLRALIARDRQNSARDAAISELVRAAEVFDGDWEGIGFVYPPMMVERMLKLKAALAAYKAVQG
jgi:hypothetical protein